MFPSWQYNQETNKEKKPKEPKKRGKYSNTKDELTKKRKRNYPSMRKKKLLK